MEGPMKRAETLLSKEELAQLTARARRDAHSGAEGEGRFEDDGPEGLDEQEARELREHARFERGMRGLRFAARTYALAGEAEGLGPVVWGTWALSAGKRWDLERTDGVERLIAATVERCGARVLEVPALAERLARSRHALVRETLAKALPVERGRRILEALAADPHADVRAAVAAKLGPLDRWGGAFPIPPDGHPDAVLEEARRVLELPWHALDPDDAVRALTPLSDALAVACWERLLMTELVSPETGALWLTRLLERPGGAAALGRLALSWGRDASRKVRWLEDATALDAAARERAYAELCASAKQTPEGSEARDRVVDAIVILAPAEGDARALLEVILGAPIEEAESGPSARPDYAELKLSQLLLRWPLEPPLRATLVEARRAGMPGRWSRLSPLVWRALGPDPVLRARAMKDLDAPELEVRGAAAAALLGEHRDPDTHDALAQELYRREPTLRRMVLGYAPALLPEARADLERGALSLGTAQLVLRKTPPEEQTDAMWAAVRPLRDAALAGPEPEDALVHLDVLVRGGGAWDPSDLAFVRHAIELVLSNEEEQGFRLNDVLTALARVDAPESAELLDELEARARSRFLKRKLAAHRDKAREAG